MAQDYASGSDVLSGDVGVQHTEPVVETEQHVDSAHLAERFGMGVAIAILLGGLLGIALMVLLGTSTATALIIAVGAGFVLAPLLGVLLAEREE
jgi:hypothetical protein